MRILTKNIIEDNSSINMTNPDTSYPVENLYNNMLEDIIQAAGSSTTITIDFDTDQIANSIFFGYHNASNITVAFKDSTDVVLDTFTFSVPQIYEKYYFNELTTIRKIEITLSTAEAYVFIGNISIGKYTQMHNVQLPITVEHIDTAVYETTLGGQVLYREGITLQSFNVDCFKLTDIQVAEFKTAYANAHKGKTWWMDRYEQLAEEPIFGFFDANYHTTRINTLTNLSFSFREAR